MKKWFVFFSLVMIVAMLAACGPAATTAPTAAPTQPPAPTTAATQPPAATTAATQPAASTCPIAPESGAKITFSGWGDPSEQKVYRDSITRFAQVCPDISVDYIPVPDKFQDKLKAQMAGGAAPDVFYVDHQLMTAFGSTNQLLPLDDLMAQAGVKASDFISAVLTPFQLNGKTYGLPKDWGTLGLVYLPEAFTDAGIAMPTDTWTWDDMRTAAKAIAAKGKFAGFCMGADWARFAPFALSNGGNYTSADFKTATLDTPEVKAMATLVADMYKEKSLVKPSDISASWCGEAIGKKLAAITTEGGWMVNFIKTTYPDVVWKAALIPAGPKTRADVVFTNAISINAATKFPKAAADFLFFVTGRTNQAEIVKTGFAYSTHPDQASLVVDPNDKEIAAGGVLPDTVPDYWGPNTGKVTDAVSKALDRVFLGDQTVDESIKQAQAEIQTALSGQ